MILFLIQKLLKVQEVPDLFWLGEGVNTGNSSTRRQEQGL